MNELWKDVKGYEGLYQVSNLGNVRSLVRQTKGKLLAQSKRRGYLYVGLYKKDDCENRTIKQVLVHRLVAEAFVSNPNSYNEVNHIDECKTNNRADNLEWCSHKYNINYGMGAIRRKQHSGEPFAKAVIQKDLEGNVLKRWRSLGEIERKTGMAKSGICRCCNRQNATAYGYVWVYADQ